MSFVRRDHPTCSAVIAGARFPAIEGMFMRRIDGLIGFGMWCAIAISALVILHLASHSSSSRADWPFTVAVCLLWLPPALSLGQWDDIPDPQSPWFYRFAVLTLLWGAAVAYGFFQF
jgi:hypothetical protein